MQREQVLGVGVVVLLVAMVATALLVPGTLAESEEDLRESYLRLADDESTLRAVDVGGETVSLQVDTRITHHGGPAENVTVELRAVDAETGLLADRQVTELGTVTGGRTVSVRSNLTVERAGGYRIETLVYEDGRLETQGRRSIRGVESLTPAYARSSIRFHEFGGSDGNVPSITYSVVSVENERVRLNVSTFLTNGGDEPAGDVSLRLRARQAESNAIADQTTVPVDTIRPGRTRSLSAALSVPDEYNYWLDAVLVRDGVIVQTASEPANLNPTRTIERDVTETEVGFSSGDFAATDQPDRGDDRPTGTASASGPGFGTAVALAALVAVGLLAIRRKHD